MYYGFSNILKVAGMRFQHLTGRIKPSNYIFVKNILLLNYSWEKNTAFLFLALFRLPCSFFQVRRHFQSLKEECSGKSMKSGSRNLNMDEKIMEMV